MREEACLLGTLPFTFATRKVMRAQYILLNMCINLLGLVDSLLEDELWNEKLCLWADHH